MLEGQFNELFENTKRLSERFGRVDEQGGQIIGPIQIEDGEFDHLMSSLDDFGDISPMLLEFEGEGNITLVVTDGERFMAIDPQGYDYPRYKTETVYDEQSAIGLAKRGRWLRKHYESKSEEEKDKVDESQKD